MSNKVWGLLLLLVAALSGCGGAPETVVLATPAIAPSVAAGELRIGEAAPDFALPTTDGGIVRLSELRGTALVINVWATWCAPCRLEMPDLQAAYEAHREEGLLILGVESRSSGSPTESVTFLREVGVTFPNYRDEAGVMEASYVRRPAYPTTIFIDREGIVRFVQVGPMDRAFIEEQLRALGF